jgi:hypothetical protein
MKTASFVFYLIVAIATISLCSCTPKLNAPKHSMIKDMLTKKFTFKRATLTCMIWADNLENACDMVGPGWMLFMITK